MNCNTKYQIFTFQRLSTEMKVSDCTGKELHAEVIFSHAIKYLKDHMLNETRSANLLRTRRCKYLLGVICTSIVV